LKEVKNRTQHGREADLNKYVFVINSLQGFMKDYRCTDKSCSHYLNHADMGKTKEAQHGREADLNKYVFVINSFT
jgi:hypothetical protein